MERETDIEKGETNITLLTRLETREKGSNRNSSMRIF